MHNLFGIEVFESLTEYVKGAQLAKEYLTDDALLTFHTVTQHYHTDAFLEEYYRVFDINPIFAKDPESLYSYMLNGLKRPGMNAPDNDNLLEDIRTKLEDDEDLIAGTLSHLTSQKRPTDIQIKNFYQLHKDFTGYKERLKNYKPSQLSESYQKELSSFIRDLERIYSNTGIWMWNHGIKLKK